MKRKFIEVVVGRVPLNVPIVIDKKTTLEIADEVNARLERIEDESGRIDTRAFALLAAISFAAELEQVQRERKDETREILLKLDEICDALEAALDEYQPQQ